MNPLYTLATCLSRVGTLRTPVSTEGALKIENGSNLIAMQ